MNIIQSNIKFNGDLSKRNKTTRIILHNSGTTVRQSVETIHEYHKSKGWAGIGYNYYVRRNGDIYTGRQDNTVGAHALNNNSNSIGVCFEGNMNEEYLSNEQILAGKELVTYLKQKYDINTVQRHSDVGQTDCPGKNFAFDEIVNGQATESNTVERKQFSRTTYIRNEPSLHSSEKYTYKANTTVEILESNVANRDGYNWDYVKAVATGREGYVAKDNSRYK